MRTLKILAFLLAAVSLSVLDEEQFAIQWVKDQVRRSPSTVSYVYQGDGWFEFTNIDGRTWFRKVGNARNRGGLKPKKVISIDLRDIDTSGYSSKVTEITRVAVGTVGAPAAVGYAQGDSTVLLAGQYFIPGPREPVRIYRKDQLVDTFHLAHSFSNGFFPASFTDFDLDEVKDMVVDSLGSIITYRTNLNSGLPTDRQYYWYGKSGSAWVPRVKDLDGDGYPEILVHQFGDGFNGTRVVKYSKDEDKLIKVYEITYPNDPGFRGYWAVGDFDMDGRQEFATANYSGEVYFVEHVKGDTGYAISFSDTTRYINAFFHTEGNDLDGDGRPECFIGSDNTFGMNNIAVYERTGDNLFEVSLWIELFPVGSFTWPWIWTGDVTGNGKDEIVLSSENVLVILEPTDKDTYKVIWYKRYNREIAHLLYDINNDKKMEILLSVYDLQESLLIILSFNNTPSGITITELPESLNLTIYPNPTTSNLTINSHIEHPGKFFLELYSINGEKLMKEVISAPNSGIYITSFSVNNIASGMYFLALSGKDKRVVKKVFIYH